MTELRTNSVIWLKEIQVEIELFNFRLPIMIFYKRLQLKNISGILHL